MPHEHLVCTNVDTTYVRVASSSDFCEAELEFSSIWGDVSLKTVLAEGSWHINIPPFQGEKKKWTCEGRRRENGLVDLRAIQRRPCESEHLSSRLMPWRREARANMR